MLILVNYDKSIKTNLIKYSELPDWIKEIL